MSSDAAAAAIAVAAEHGLRCDEPAVLADAWHVLVHLRPLPLVARISTTVPYPEGPAPEDLVRELDVAAHLARVGAPVIPPTELLDPGPHRAAGRLVTFWRYVEPEGELDPGEAGRRLRVIHEGLADYIGPLPPAGHPADLEAMLAALPPSADIETLRDIAARAPGGDGRPLHGDAHLGNCFSSARGALWHDFECACRGAPEYDLAALVLRDRISGGHQPAREALDAYGDHDGELLDALLPLYAAWVYASLLIAASRAPEIGPLAAERIAWLRANARGAS